MSSFRRVVGLAAVLAWTGVAAEAAHDLPADGVERFFLACPSRPRLRVHDDERAWDLHAVFFTTISVSELEILRIADLVIDLPLPGRPLRPFDRTFKAIRSGYGKLPKWTLTRRIGQFADAWRIPELSIGDVSSAYSVASGGLSAPSSGTLARMDRLVDWSQAIVGDVNRSVGRLVRRPRGLLRSAWPARVVDGTQWLIQKTFHSVHLVLARTLEHTLRGIELAAEHVGQVGHRRPHRETTVFLRLPPEVFRDHASWITQQRRRIVSGPAAWFRQGTHAELAHGRRETVRTDVPPSAPEDPIILMMSLRVFSRAPDALKGYVVPAAWILDGDTGH